jgi:hypothetical protein
MIFLQLFINYKINIGISLKIEKKICRMISHPKCILPLEVLNTPEDMKAVAIKVEKSDVSKILKDYGQGF